MSIAEAFLTEFDQEMRGTRTVLERAPEDRMDWRPHERSMTLKALTDHIAHIPFWMRTTLEQDEFDVAAAEKTGEGRHDLASLPEALAFLDESVEAVKTLLREATDERMTDPWTMRRGETVMFSRPRTEVIRHWVLNHLIHHRGQLTVYLRLLDVPVPRTYGPTADEPNK